MRYVYTVDVQEQNAGEILSTDTIGLFTSRKKAVDAAIAEETKRLKDKNGAVGVRHEQSYDKDAGSGIAAIRVQFNRETTYIEVHQYPVQ